MEIAREWGCHASWQGKNSLKLDILHSCLRMRKILEFRYFVKKSVEVAT